MTARHLLPTLPDIHPDDSRGRGVLTSERGVFPLIAMEVEADVTGLVAAMTIRQTFANPYPDPLEASYIFPLPDRAAVTGFHITVGGRRIAGDIRERQAARDAYDQAVAAGQRAALLEEERPDVFTTHVGNLAPSEEATIELALSGPVACELGEATLRVPLVVAPRYIPGRPLEATSVGEGTELDTDAVPDASRITPPRLAPGAPNPVRLSITARLDPAGMSARDLGCSLAGAMVSGSFPAPATVEVQPGQRLDRDFILRWTVAGQTSGVAAVAVPDGGDSDEGTYLVTVVPPQAAKAARPRDVVLLLDRSGSMGGWKMVAARRAAARIVDSLTSIDRFTVIAFDHVVERPPGLVDAGLATATERHRYQAVEWMGRLEARGGTEMAAALAQGHRDLAQCSPGDGPDVRARCCILVTDGQVGNEDQLVAIAGDAGVRIYTVGIDRAVNAWLLQRLAAVTAGRCDLVESEDHLDAVLADLHRRISQPVAESVTVRFDGLAADTATQVPPGGADLFPGVPLTISGRYRGQAYGRVEAGDAAGVWNVAADVTVATN
ncbi:MAG: VIT domain-containing protein, partial [Acidimicrobiales bacterium]